MPTTISRMQDERLAGAVAVLVALAGMAVANFSLDPGENGGPLEFAVTSVVMLAVAALVFGRLLPGTERPARAATWLTVGTVLTVPVFWSGLPVVLGAGAFVAGLRSSSVAATIAGAIGALVAVAATVLMVTG